MKVLVTGGAGFIGSALVRHLLGEGDAVVTLDKLTYAGSDPLPDDPAAGGRHWLEVADVADGAALARIFTAHRPDAVMHLAAETHVDRSIDAPDPFIATNLVGTYRLLEAALAYVRSLDEAARARFRFHHVSTDEVFGSLPPGTLAREDAPYRPNSPYAASKAGADHLVRAWHRTYALPVIATNSSNNYGPRQFPEKLVPLMILNAFAGRTLPIYGDGGNVRDWLYVGDHAAALALVLRRGEVGESYNIAGGAAMTNLALVRRLCAILDEELPQSPHRPHERLIAFVADRPGHDRCYGVDDGKLRQRFGWRPAETIDSGLRKTVQWYRDNRAWWEPIRSMRYGGERLGLAAAAGEGGR